MISARVEASALLRLLSGYRSYYLAKSITNKRLIICWEFSIPADGACLILKAHIPSKSAIQNDPL